MPYKKRRVIKAVNKNEQKSLRNRNSDRPLASYFPNVQRLILDLRFFTKTGALLDEQHHNYTPQDEISFSSECLGGCGEGTLDLKAKIQSAVEAHKESGEGKAQCPSRLYSGDELCGCEVKCTFKIEYNDAR